MRLPTTGDQHELCRVDGWTAERESGHTFYRRILATGEVLSFPVGHGEKPLRNPDLFAYICREELRCTPGQFWDSVDHGIPVPRPRPEAALPEDPIPYGLIRVLRALGHSEERIRQLRTKAEAIELRNQGPAI